MKLNLILKMLPIEIILALELKTNENVMKLLNFEFLSRILTCSLMKLSLILKILPTEIFLALELTANQNMMKWLCFVLMSRILTCSLIFRLWITYIYVFKLLFGFFNFWASSRGFRSRDKFIQLCIKFCLKSSIFLKR